MDNVFSFLHHLGFCNPESCFGDSYGKVIKLNAEKLGDRNFYGICNKSYCYLTFLQFEQNFVFEFTQRNISFGQKIPAAAGRVKKI